MFKLQNAIIGLVMGALLLVGTGVAIALSPDEATIKAEQRLKLACKGKASSRKSNGKRDMMVHSYRLEKPSVGVVKGGFKTEFRPKRWTPISWTCRINPKSRRVLSVKFGWTGGGSRLLEAAQLRR